jgi:hypothetical protein
MNLGAQHFSQSATARSNSMNLGGFSPGFMPRYQSAGHPSTNASGINGKTKLHNLSNALQQQSHPVGSNQTSSDITRVRSPGQRAALKNDSLAAGSNSASSNPSVQGTSPSTLGARTATPLSQAPITGTMSLNTASTATSASSIGAKPFSLTSTGPNMTAVTGALAGTAATGTSTPVSSTNPNGLAATQGAASTSLMSHLYGGYGYSTYGGSNVSHRLHGAGYGSRYNSSRYYGTSNNSMYFAQMRRLSQLVNALNSLSRGSTASATHAARLRGALMGVVVNNGQPPFQAVNQLSTDLVTHLPNRTTPILNTGQLARDLMIAMNASGQNLGQVQHAVNSAHSVLDMSGVNQQGVQRIGTDMMMVASGGNLANPIVQFP